MSATTTTTWPSADLPEQSDDAVAQLDGWWRAANYLSVGQLYLLNNPCCEPRWRDWVRPAARGVLSGNDVAATASTGGDNE